jgi:NAD(P)-dependent dehydrogenase (short-subunit alcohol dehydrogenase family)
MRQLGAAGYQVVGIDLASAVPDEGYLACDITDQAQVAAAFGQVTARYGRIDLLVNNAGISAIGGFADHDIAVWRQVMEVNFFGAVLCTRAALPGLRAAGGRVVVISSVAGFAPVLGRPAYVGAKHAVTGTFEAIRSELAGDGIALTLDYPTFVTGGMSESARPAGVRRSTTGPQISPADVAAAIAAGVGAGRDRVLIGAIAHQSWWVNRLAPGVYRRLMVRRLAKS